MMLGEQHRPNHSVHVPPWDDQSSDLFSPNNGGSSDYSPYYLQEALSALQRFLPSNDSDLDPDFDIPGLDHDSPIDAYSCDHFRMYEFKVRRCARGRSHDWTECPYAHPGEKARRRDPRKYHYSGTACPEFRKGSCKKGDGCEFAHGVFECWLHPARYRTQPCKDGTNCKRRVCFFAHTPEQLRVLPQSPRSVNSADSYDGSPLRQAIEASCVRNLPFLASSSPGSNTPPEVDSPPMSPMTQSPLSRSLGSNSINEMVASLRNLQIGKVPSLPSSWNVQVGGGGGGGGSLYGSPRAGSILRPGFCSVPTTPTRTPSGLRYHDFWDKVCEEEPAMERVESGRGIRERMLERLSKENNMLERVDDPGFGPAAGGPDVDWVSDLVQ
ncbi:Zinc finger CCCH domain-containing protein 20 [Linum grandiflorum]